MEIGKARRKIRALASAMKPRRRRAPVMPFDPKSIDADRTPTPATDAPRGVCRLCRLPIVGRILTTNLPGIGREHWHPECHERTRPRK